MANRSSKRLAQQCRLDRQYAHTLAKQQHLVVGFVPRPKLGMVFETGRCSPAIEPSADPRCANQRTMRPDFRLNAGHKSSRAHGRNVGRAFYGPPRSVSEVDIKTISILWLSLTCLACLCCFVVCDACAFRHPLRHYLMCPEAPSRRVHHNIELVENAMPICFDAPR